MTEIINLFDSDKKEYWIDKIGACDWGPGDLLHYMIVKGTFFDFAGEGSEILLLTDRDELISFCTYAKRDDIHTTDLTPWMGFVFTYPEYRGERKMGILFDEVIRRAKNDGFTEFYISTTHTGLYEKFGCEFLTQMLDFDNEPTRVYVRKISQERL